MCDCNNTYTERIVSQNTEILAQATTIGSLQSSLKALELANVDLRRDIEEKKPLVKVIYSAGTRNLCNSCGCSFDIDSDECPDCGGYDYQATRFAGHIDYKNLDEIRTLIANNETKDLLVKQKKLVSELSKLNETVVNNRTAHAAEVEKVRKANVRDRARLLEDHAVEIEKLNTIIVDQTEELDNIKVGIVAEEIEESRKQAIIELKSEIEVLRGKLAKYLSMPFWKKVLYSNKERDLEVDAKEQYQTRVDAVDHINQNYSNWWSRSTLPASWITYVQRSLKRLRYKA